MSIIVIIMAYLEKFDSNDIDNIDNIIEEEYETQKFVNLDTRLNYIITLIINLSSFLREHINEGELCSKIQLIINKYCKEYISANYYEYDSDDDPNEHTLGITIEIINRFNHLKDMHHWTLYGGTDAETDKRIDNSIDLIRFLKVYMDIFHNTNRDVYSYLQRELTDHYFDIVNAIKEYSSRTGLIEELHIEFKTYLIDREKEKEERELHLKKG